MGETIRVGTCLNKDLKMTVPVQVEEDHCRIKPEAVKMEEGDQFNLVLSECEW